VVIRAAAIVRVVEVPVVVMVNQRHGTLIIRRGEV